MTPGGNWKRIVDAGVVFLLMDLSHGSNRLEGTVHTVPRMRVTPTSAGVLGLLWLSGCYLSHQGIDDWDGASPSCADPALAPASLSDDERNGLLGRLFHELEHLSESVQRGRLAPAGDRVWTYSEDGGSMVVVGLLEERGEDVALVAEITFTHWSGRHGGWGYSALDGRACVSIVASGGADESEPVVRLSAVVRLVEDGPLRGTPTVNVSYVASAGFLEGSIAGRAIDL